MYVGWVLHTHFIENTLLLISPSVSDFWCMKVIKV